MDRKQIWLGDVARRFRERQGLSGLGLDPVVGSFGSTLIAAGSGGTSGIVDLATREAIEAIDEDYGEAIGILADGVAAIAGLPDAESAEEVARTVCPVFEAISGGRAFCEGVNEAARALAGWIVDLWPATALHPWDAAYAWILREMARTPGWSLLSSATITSYMDEYAKAGTAGWIIEADETDRAPWSMLRGTGTIDIDARLMAILLGYLSSLRSGPQLDTAYARALDIIRGHERSGDRTWDYNAELSPLFPYGRARYDAMMYAALSSRGIDGKYGIWVSTGTYTHTDALGTRFRWNVAGHAVNINALPSDLLRGLIVSLVAEEGRMQDGFILRMRNRVLSGLDPNRPEKYVLLALVEKAHRAPSTGIATLDQVASLHRQDTVRGDGGGRDTDEWSTGEIAAAVGGGVVVVGGLTALIGHSLKWWKLW